MFDRWRLKSQLETADLRLQVTERQIALDRLEEALRLESTQRTVSDETAADWIMLGARAGLDDKEAAPLSETDHYKMLDQSWIFWRTNLHARAIIRNVAKFILGKGPTVKPVDDNVKVREVWDQFAKDNRWSLREKEIIARAFRDGEVFLRKFKDKKTGSLKVRFIRAQNIRNPRNEKEYNKGENVSYGIGTDKDDIENVLTYYYCLGEKLVEKIPAEEVIHIKILSDSDMKRGMSFLLVAMPMIKKYESWLEDRIVLNKIRSAIALVRHVDAGASTVESVRGSQRTEHTDSDRMKLKVPARGTVLTAGRGIKYEMLSPNVNAGDVSEDGRAMLLSIAAGCGMPEMILTADFSNSNYSSSMVAQNPFVREIEDWQDLFEFYYMKLFEDVIRANIEGEGDEKLPDATKLTCTIEWPPLILANIVENNNARQVQFRNKILSRKTWAMKEGLDPAEEEKNLIEEDSKEIYKEPFNMPSAPANQYGKYGGEEPIEGFSEEEEE